MKIHVNLKKAAPYLLGLLILFSLKFSLSYFAFWSELTMRGFATSVSIIIHLMIAVNSALLARLLIHDFMRRLASSKKQKSTTISAVSNLMELIAYVLISLFFLQSIGVNISSIVAFGGFAGLAVGLAAKDLLANIFGGLMIYWDRPFNEGEWIRSPDRNIEGTVAKIGLRVTKINTFDKRPLYVPNSMFNNIVIENPSRMSNRRIAESFCVRYSDNHQVDKIVAQIEKMLHDNDAICNDSGIMVHLLGLGASSLDCEVYCFTKSTDWKIYRSIRQQVLLEIIRIVRKNGADVPFPTRTIDLPQFSAQIPAIGAHIVNESSAPNANL